MVPSLSLDPAPLKVHDKLAQVAVNAAVGDTLSVTVHVHSAGDGSVLADVSMARTRKVCGPTPRPKRVVYGSHHPKGSPSRLQAKRPGSLEWKAKVADLDVVTAGGPAVIVVSGGMLSSPGAVTSMSSTFATMSFEHGSMQDANT